MRRYAAKRDANERSIIDILRSTGYSVDQIDKSGFPDLIVGGYSPRYDLNMNWLIEIKTESGHLTRDQKAWFNEWQGTAYIARTVERVFYILGYEKEIWVY